MIRHAVLILCLLSAPASSAATVAEAAAAAAADLKAAVAGLEEATGGRDQVRALTATIRAYEEGLTALREGLRQARLREATLALQLEAKRDRVAQLLGVLGRMEGEPAPLLLLHPSGPLGTVRSAMMLADVTPAMQAEVDVLRAELAEIRDLRAVRDAAGETLAAGLGAVQDARTALSQAISDRTDQPRRLIEDTEALRMLLESADTLDVFAAGLAPMEAEADGMVAFPQAKGTLPLPVLGTVLRRPGEADAAGVRRPGLSLATRASALVTAPWPATIRYRGPLLDYGNVMILEPGGGYLLVLAGLATVYGGTGEVVEAGAPLGLMGGAEQGTAEFPASGDGLIAGGDGGQGRETLYIELRQGAEPVDPQEWFGVTATPQRPRARVQAEE